MLLLDLLTGVFDVVGLDIAAATEGVLALVTVHAHLDADCETAWAVRCLAPDILTLVELHETIELIVLKFVEVGLYQ